MRLPQSDEAKRLAIIMHRRLTTGWTPRERAALLDRRKEGCFDHEEDLLNLERFYSANWPPDRNKNNLRHDLLTLLNHLQGEFGKAAIWVDRNPIRKVRKIIPLPPIKGEPYVAPTDPVELANLAKFEAERLARKKVRSAEQVQQMEVA